MKFLILGIIGVGLILTGGYMKFAFAQPDDPDTVNIRQLSWEIKKATGINCGGYPESDGTPQKCNITYIEGKSVTVTLSSDIEHRIGEVMAVVAKHNPSDDLPLDFPTATLKTPVPTLKQQYQEALTDSERIDILAEAAGLK